MSWHPKDNGLPSFIKEAIPDHNGTITVKSEGGDGCLSVTVETSNSRAVTHTLTGCVTFESMVDWVGTISRPILDQFPRGSVDVIYDNSAVKLFKGVKNYDGMLLGKTANGFSKLALTTSWDRRFEHLNYICDDYRRRLSDYIKNPDDFQACYRFVKDHIARWMPDSDYDKYRRTFHWDSGECSDELEPLFDGDKPLWALECPFVSKQDDTGEYVASIYPGVTEVNAGTPEECYIIMAKNYYGLFGDSLEVHSNREF